MTSSAQAMAMSCWLLLAAACSASTPTGGHKAAGPGPPASGEPAAQGDDRFVTSRNDGSVLHMRVGDTRTLWVPDPTAPDPSVNGDAVQLVAMVAIQDSGERSWEVRAVRPGHGRIAIAGTAPFTVDIAVAAK